MSQLTPEQAAEHQAVEERTVSGQFLGPHAVFTKEELREIWRQAPDPRTEIWKNILAKVQTALQSDPKFKQPLP